MADTVLYTIFSLSGLGLSSAFVLFVVANRFKVYENPLIAEVEAKLSGANCGGCGEPGCRAFAEVLVNSDDISGFYCPVGGNDMMGDIATMLGKEVVKQDPQVAVVQCNGSCESRPRVTKFMGPDSCRVSSLVYAGETGCDFGCLGKGDCVDVCKFDAIYIDQETMLPVIDDEACTGCNACVIACPKLIMELRPKKKRNLKIYVACKNTEKGGIAKRACAVACIGCSKCVKVCPKDAIDVTNFLAYIDPKTCTLCRKCVDECPTDSILEFGFPPKKKKEEKKEKALAN